MTDERPAADVLLEAAALQMAKLCLDLGGYQKRDPIDVLDDMHSSGKMRYVLYLKTSVMLKEIVENIKVKMAQTIIEATEEGGAT